MEIREKTHLTIKEVRLLAGALGFTRDLVQSKVPSHVIVDETISLQDLVHYCDEGFFAQELHFTYNNKTGNYNTEVFKRAALHYAQGNVTVNEIRDARMAFETYEEFDQRGMVICARTLMRTLKIIGWVVAPEKLIKKIRHVKMAYQEKGRIQLYEFLDLLPLCERLPVRCGNGNTEHSSSVGKTERQIYNVDDFHKFMIPEDKRLHAHLNRCYHQEQLRYGKPYFISQPFPAAKPLVIKQPFDSQMEQSAKDLRNIRKQLNSTDKEIKLSKSGNLDWTNRRANLGQSHQLYMDATSECDKVDKNGKLGKSTQTGEPSASGGKRRRRTSTTVGKRQPSARYDQAITDSTNTKTMISQLAFDLNTQDIRSRQRLHDRLKHYLPNYEQVMKRVEQKRRADEVKQSSNEQQQPVITASPYAFNRLSKPRTGVSPKHHLHHCTASHRHHGNSSRRPSATTTGEYGRKKKVRRVRRKIRKVKNEENAEEPGNMEVVPIETRCESSEEEEEEPNMEEFGCHVDPEEEDEATEQVIEEKEERCRELQPSEVSDIIRKMGKVYIKYNTDEPAEKHSNQKMKEKLEQRTQLRRKMIADIHRRDNGMQTTNVSEFELQYLSIQPGKGETDWAKRPISTNVRGATDIEKEVKLRRTFHKIAKRILNHGSAYLCSMESVKNLTSMYQQRDV